ncbi:hypothetical protein JMUB6875_17040 [Nocardia sp. JMUB6875]|uniref:hypothetical protein n=1 Tax=Nocardia sp. JMUB6875 TaxID=3158170 RepID=UPI0032E7597F
MKRSIAARRHVACPQHKNPGREGGPIGFRHTADGIVAIGEDGFPIIADHDELDQAADSAELEEYSMLDIRPVCVTDVEHET